MITIKDILKNKNIVTSYKKCNSIYEKYNFLSIKYKISVNFLLKLRKDFGQNVVDDFFSYISDAKIDNSKSLSGLAYWYCKKNTKKSIQQSLL